MTAPQPRFQFRVREEQPSCGVALEYFDRISEASLGLTAYEQMYVIRHDFHGEDVDLHLLCRLTDIVFRLDVQTVYENCLSVLLGVDYFRFFSFPSSV